MANYLYGQVQALIHDTNEAFMSCGGSVNTDYAEFAGMALSEFKAVLKNPALTRSELVGMLRRGMAKSKCDDPGQWPILMAHQLRTAANSDFA